MVSKAAGGRDQMNPRDRWWFYYLVGFLLLMAALTWVASEILSRALP